MDTGRHFRATPCSVLTFLPLHLTAWWAFYPVPAHKRVFPKQLSWPPLSLGLCPTRSPSIKPMAFP